MSDHAQMIQSLSSMSLSDSDKEDNLFETPNLPSYIAEELNKIRKAVSIYLIATQLKLDFPSRDRIENFPIYAVGDNEEDFQKRFQHIAETIKLTIECKAEFARNVPGFPELCVDVRILLMKVAIMELIVLDGARKYDIKTDSIVFINNQPHTYEDYVRAGFEDFANCLFPFCRDLCSLKMDQLEYGLLAAIIIFSVSETTESYLNSGEIPQYVMMWRAKCEKDPAGDALLKRIGRIRQFYVNALKTYILNNRPLGQNYFDWLNITVSELHILSLKLINLLKQNKNAGNFSPLVKEIWEMDQ